MYQEKQSAGNYIGYVVVLFEGTAGWCVGLKPPEYYISVISDRGIQYVPKSFVAFDKKAPDEINEKMNELYDKHGDSLPPARYAEMFGKLFENIKTAEEYKEVLAESVRLKATNEFWRAIPYEAKNALIEMGYSDSDKGRLYTTAEEIWDGILPEDKQEYVNDKLLLFKARVPQPDSKSKRISDGVVGTYKLIDVGSGKVIHSTKGKWRGRVILFMGDKYLEIVGLSKKIKIEESDTFEGYIQTPGNAVGGSYGNKTSQG